MQGEADGSLRGESGFRIPVKNLDINVLIECSRKSVTRRRQYSPAAAARRGVCYGRLVSRIAKPKNGKRFEIPVQVDGPVS